MCGPYTITAINSGANSVALEHISNPPPVGQLLHTSWSLRAGVFPISDFNHLPPEDPATSGLAIDTVFPRPIDCILSCTLCEPPLPVPETPAHVRNHKFLVRWLGKSQTEASHVPYETVKHTLACDRFCAANAFLIGHCSILRPPTNFDPHVRPISERPAQPPVPSSELHIHADSSVIRTPLTALPHRGRPSFASPPPARVPSTPPTPARPSRAAAARAPR